MKERLMTDINWDVFRVKFHGKEREEFEYLSYLLFCYEFNQNIGILQYKNQIGIETEPIEINGKSIGFQAKFYDTSLSTNKKDIIDSIDKAKEKNPNLDVIYLYTNKDLSESRNIESKKPKYQKEIEDHANKLGVELIWRMTSNIKVQLMKDENKSLRERFFALEPNINSLVQDLQEHSLNILENIKSEIIFNSIKIKFNRDSEIKVLKDNLLQSRVSILAGDSGVGKSAIIKDLHQEIKNEYLIFLFKPANFVGINNVNSLFNSYGNFTMNQFVSTLDNIETKYLVIDSAEKLFDLENMEIFNEFLNILEKYNWKLIFTIRKNYLEKLKAVIKSNIQTIIVDGLSDENINEISDKYGIRLPNDNKIFDLIKNPFYFSEFLNIYNNHVDNSIDLEEFKNVIWENQVKKSNSTNNVISLRRETQFLSLAHKIATNGFFSIELDNVDYDALNALESDQLIYLDSHTNSYFITHDIYEDWALKKIVEKNFRKEKNNTGFFKSLGVSYPIRRAFREWLMEKLYKNERKYNLFIHDYFYNKDIDDIWKEEIIVSFLLLDKSNKLFNEYERNILEDLSKNIDRIIYYLRTACKVIDEDQYVSLNFNIENSQFYFTKPKGVGWPNTIEFIYRNKDKITIDSISIVSSLLFDWNNYRNNGKTTKYSSKLALYLYKKIYYEENSRWRIDEEIKLKLIQTIMLGAGEIKEDLTLIFERFIERNNPTHRDEDYKLIKTILTSFIYNTEVVKHFPDYVIELSNLLWTYKPRKTYPFYSSSIGIEVEFGLADNLDFIYSNSSAFQTPIYKLLKYHTKSTIEFILEFVNKSVLTYSKSGFKDEIEKIEIIVDENKKVTQYASGRLWYMYIGRSSSPYLLESIHMALEKYLLEYSETATSFEIEKLLIYLIENSQSASITAVVTSIVLAFPTKLFNIAKILFSNKEIFFYDNYRLSHFRSVVHLPNIYFGNSNENKILSFEREESNKYNHRNKTLKQLIIEYQLIHPNEITNVEFERRRSIIWGILDNHNDNLIKNEINKWSFNLLQMDARKLKVESVHTDNLNGFKLTPILDHKHLDYKNSVLKDLNSDTNYNQLFVWAFNRLENNDSTNNNYHSYDENPQDALIDIKQIITENNSCKLQNSIINSPLNVCYVLLRDFYDKLTQDEIDFCKNVILDSAISLYETNNLSMTSEFTLYNIINSLIYLINNLNLDIEELMSIRSIILMILLTNKSKIHEYNNESVLEELWIHNFEEANSIWLGYLSLNPRYNDFYFKLQRELLLEFNENKAVKEFKVRYESELAKFNSYTNEHCDIKNLSKLDFETLTIAYKLLPLDLYDDTHIEFLHGVINIISKDVFNDSDIDLTRDFHFKFKIMFLNKFSNWILRSDKIDYETYLRPFKDNFKISNDTYLFFECFIIAQSEVGRYNNFWNVRNYFYENIKTITESEESNTNMFKLVYTYLLAKDIKKVNLNNLLSEKNKKFYEDVSNDMGNRPVTIYSISIILYESILFNEEGVLWFSKIITKNKEMLEGNLINGTIFYMNKFISRYVTENINEIKKDLKIKNYVMDVLNFLVINGSEESYAVREKLY